MSDDSLKERREQLRRALADRAYGEEYADSVLFENVSAQAQAIRRQRGMTQERLAELIGSKQPRVSNVESPKQNPEWPNWEVSTLNRIAHALGTRLEIKFKSYGSLVAELATVTSESLRIPEYEDDPLIFQLPSKPEPDPAAPEGTRWMQELMISWLWEDQLDLPRLYDWLHGRGLPPVGHDEEPYQWLLRGIAVLGPAREHLEKRFAERLSILLGEEPDTTMRDGGDDYLRNLYWTCAGLRRPSFLAEQLWRVYKRLRRTKLRGDVRDGLQAALVQNQYGETKPLKEVWEPMVMEGRARGLRGDEVVGYEGILARHATVRPDIDKVFWALGTISHRWDESRKAEFRRLIFKVPDLDRFEVARRLIASARRPEDGWSQWAIKLLPGITYPKRDDGSLTILVTFDGTELFGSWPAGGNARTGITDTSSSVEHDIELSGLQGRPNRVLLLNELLTRLGNETHSSASERTIAHAMLFEEILDREPVAKALILATVKHEIDHPMAA